MKAEHVGGGGAQQLPAADRTHRGHRGLGVVLVALGGRHHLGAQPGQAPGLQLGVVAEDGDRLGRAQQQAGRVPAGREHVGHPLGRLGLVPQQPQVPGRRPQFLADLAERQQARVGFGGVGEPAEQDGQQRALDRRAPGHARGQRVDVVQRPGRVHVTERLEPGPGLGGRQPGGVGGQPGHRVEQRPVEQLLVQPPDLTGVAAPLLVEIDRRVGADPGDRGLEPGFVRPIIKTHRPAQPAKYGGILGQGVRAAEPAELQQVLGAAQEPVGGAEFLRVGPADVAAGGQRGQRGQRRGRAQGLVGAAVHELQQLDGELDVAQPAGTELELAPGLPGGQRLLHPAPHGLHVLDEMLAAGRLPDQRAEGIRVRLAERHVAGHRPGLEQRLELPGLGPALVVGQVAGQRADQRAGPAFRAQVRVDREDAAFRGGPRAHADQPGRQAAGGAQRGGLVLVLDRFGHEDHVDVAGVVQLAAAALAHGHHGQPARRRAGRQFGPGHGERRLEDRGRDVGQFLAHHVHGRDPGEVPRREVQQPAPVGRGQRGHRLLRRRPSGSRGRGGPRRPRAACPRAVRPAPGG